MPSIEAQTQPAVHDDAAVTILNQARRILFLDAYDSFTNNIVSLIKDALGKDVIVHVLHMDFKTLHTDPTPDWTPEEFLARLPSFDAVVCGPGPGSPLVDADVGAFKLLWSLPREKAVPVLGICLGFQSLVAEFGGGIRKLRRGIHGMIRSIDHYGLVDSQLGDLYKGVPAFSTTLYHSLCADFGQDTVPEEKWAEAKWLTPKGAPDLTPLAWAYETNEQGETERILQSVRHAKLPYWGVQYHPESVCTDPEVKLVLRNWFEMSLKWNDSIGRAPSNADDGAYPDSFDPKQIVQYGVESRKKLAARQWWQEMQSGLAATEPGTDYVYRQIKLPADVDVADLAEDLGLGDVDTIILDSSSTITGDPLARNSILALDVANTMRFEYHVGDNYVTIRRPKTADKAEEVQKISLGDKVDPFDAWNVLSEFWQQRKISDEEGQPTFKGGFMGFVSYEMGLSTLSPGIVGGDRGHHNPDLCFAWVTRSIALDHMAGVAYVQSLAGKSDDAWLDAMVEKITTAPSWSRPHRTLEEDRALYGEVPKTNEALLEDIRKPGRLAFTTPDAAKYEADVRQCQAHIREGQTYELCLTGQTDMTRPAGDDLPVHLGGTKNPEHGTPWHMYRSLRARQACPFGSYIRLGGATIISSSPERFLGHDAKGLCSMRPMKGTVRKSEEIPDVETAAKVLHIPKEEAENLMIVDLVRHDLYGVCGTGNVDVPDLLKVEEYATVFQMITVVNGQLPKTEEGSPAVTGLDVLAYALPPGSMTGAPKKRSCEILTGIEQKERSIYSGVVGYLDVKGQADWSVNIRILFRWDDEKAPAQGDETEPREIWRIGAGGAVTILSTPHGETEEMFLKICGPVSTFKEAA